MACMRIQSAIIGASYACVLLLGLCAAPVRAAGKVILYPTPAGLQTSTDFSLKVNGQPVWVEKLQSNFAEKDVPSWFLTPPYMKLPEQVNIANFSCTGPISVALAAGEPITSYNVRPRSRGIKAVVKGKTLNFDLPGPDNLYIEVNALPALCLFANPPETDAPNPDDKNVLYFGPGVHKPGLITLLSNQTIYIAGGAIVYGAVQGSASRARIIGRGILDGNYQQRLVRLDNCYHVEVNGVILRNGRSWQNTLTNCLDITYRNVKVISFGNSGDGINPVGSHNVTIDNCFLRCTDDCVAIKAPRNEQTVEGIKVINSTLIGYAFSDGVTIGFETNGPYLKDIQVKNCDVLIARGGSRVEGHSAFSIICDGPARISNVTYEDIRVEENVEKLFELQVTDGTKYQADPPGHIKDVYLKNIRWEVDKPIILQGFDGQHLVEDVTFDNCTVAGKKLESAKDGSFKINAHVRDVKVK